MNENTAPAAGKRHHGVSKFLNKDRWKEKLASNLAGSSDHDRTSNQPEPPAAAPFALNDDVNDFLKPSTSKLRPVSPKAPRIGIDIAAAQKWASNSAGHGSLPTPSSLRKKDYPRRALNLQVRFTNAVPDIIGEGGDESEEPVAEIGKRLEKTRPQRQPSLPPRPGVPGGAQAGSSNLRQQHVSVDGQAAPAAQVLTEDDFQPPPKLNHHRHTDSFPNEEPDFVPKPIKRTQTSYDGLEGESENVRPSMDSASLYSAHSSIAPAEDVPQRVGQLENYQLPALDTGAGNAPMTIVTKRLEDMHFGGKRNSLSSPSLQEKIHKMRAEEGHALSSAVEQDPFVDHFAEATSRLSSSTTTSARPGTGESGGHRTFSDTRPPVTDSPAVAMLSTSLQPQAQMQSSYSATPSPSQAPGTPESQPRTNYQHKAPPTPEIQSRSSYQHRKPIAAPQPINSQLRPTSNDANTNPSPRLSPALNVTIPQRPDMRSPSGSGPPTAGVPGAYRQSAEMSATSSVGHSAQTPYTASSAVRPTPDATPGAALGQTALDDFADRCSHMGGIFRLQAEFSKPMYEYTPSQWLRAATWWFLKGRAGIEVMVRDKSRGAQGSPEGVIPQERLAQPHVDLAKTWWVLTEVLAQHPALPVSQSADYGERCFEARNAGDNITAEIFESCDVLMFNLKSILASMKRNQVMPPTHALIQGQDQTMWLKYPDFSAQLLPVLAGASGRALTESNNIPVFNPLRVIGVGDTRLDFSYNRVFVNASLGFDGDDNDRLIVPVVVSVMRERNDWHPKVAICSQLELVTICIQGDRKRGPSWQDVKWSEQHRSLHVLLPHGYSLTVQLNEPDFRQLFNLYNHTFRVQSSLLPLADEKVAYETSLFDFQYRDSRQPPAFPPERIKRCRVRLFAKTQSIVEAGQQRTIFQGFRLLAVTSPKNRILGSACHEIGIKFPTILAAKQDSANPGLPAVTLYVQEERRQCSLLMVFGSDKELYGFLDVLHGSGLAPGESRNAAVRLKAFNMETIDQGDALTNAPRNPFSRMQWTDISTFTKDPETPDSAHGALAPYENTRVIAESIEGTLTDRINIGPGELLIRLSPDGHPALTIFRQPQIDFSITIDPSRTDKNLPLELADSQRMAFMLPTTRTFSFYSHEDLHQFQHSITSFHVAYDGLAQAFTIARRRPVTALSRHKKIEAGTTRLQIVAHVRQKIIQLLAFFDDMPQAEAMNFQLKPVDVYEKYDDKHSRGRYGLKIVDCKFSLPGKGLWERDERERVSTPDGIVGGKIEDKFVCLDVLEPPAENDDIVIGFESEAERDRFIEALPAPPQAHRGLTLRRKI